MRQFEVSSGMHTGCGKKVLLYGQEGVGKTSLAAAFPGCVFIDTEGSTSFMDVKRLPKPDSWEMLKEECRYVLECKQFQTLVIDTFDWAERLCIAQLCQKHQVDGIEGFGYGKGWEYEAEEIGRFLDMTEQLVQAGIHVVLCCHAVTRKVSLPEEEDYDHWELKLGSKTTNRIAPLLKEWSDMTLFLAFKTHVIATDKEGKKHKATGCDRVMYATKTAWWDAKNRFGLADKLPLDYGQIAHLFPAATQAPAQTPAQAVVEKAKASGVPVEVTMADLQDSTLIIDENGQLPPIVESKEEQYTQNILDGIHPKLASLMAASSTKPEQLQYVVGTVKGYFPADMPVAQYPEDFVEQWCIPFWTNIQQVIQEGIQKGAIVA